MADFDADWLSLREPADARSRDRGLMHLLATWSATRQGLRILDLGCGTGANLRALAPFLGSRQRWIALDRDRALLDHLPARDEGPGWSADVEPRLGELEAFDWPPVEVATASALLDLVSEDWLKDLISQHSGIAFYFALSIDGRIELTPSHPADKAVLSAFDADLRRDKGLGPALGGKATAVAERLLRDAGYRVARASSDWKLGVEDSGLAAAWLRGVTEAPIVKKEIEKSAITDWFKARLEALSSGDLRLRIGHQDLLALPL